MGRIFRGLFWLILASLSSLPLAAQQAETNGQVVTGTIEGVVVAARSWDVTPKVSNLISRLHFTEGIEVEKGDLLVEMNRGFKQLERDLAEAVRDRAKVLLAEAEDDLQRQKKLKAREAV